MKFCCGCPHPYSAARSKAKRGRLSADSCPSAAPARTAVRPPPARCPAGCSARQSAVRAGRPERSYGQLEPDVIQSKVIGSCRESTIKVAIGGICAPEPGAGTGVGSRVESLRYRIDWLGSPLTSLLQMFVAVTPAP